MLSILTKDWAKATPVQRTFNRERFGVTAVGGEAHSSCSSPRLPPPLRWGSTSMT